MGPGFDCLGMALDLWNRMTVTALADNAVPSVEVAGEGEGELATDIDNLVYQAMAFLL